MACNWTVHRRRELRRSEVGVSHGSSIMQPFPARGDLAHASQHMANDTLMSFLRPTNTTFYTPSNRVYGARPMTVSGSPSPPRGPPSRPFPRRASPS